MMGILDSFLWRPKDSFFRSNYFLEGCERVNFIISNQAEESVDAMSATLMQWSLYYQRTQLFAAFCRALARANNEGHAILASFVFQVEPCDALCIMYAFEQLQIDESFFWEQPDKGEALVGAGSVMAIESRGKDRFSRTRAVWQKLQKETMIEYLPGVPAGLGGPILLGGFAFDPFRPTTSLWRNFPDGLHILPAYLYHSRGQQASFTVNQVVQAGSNIEMLVDKLVATLHRLQRNVGNCPPVSTLSTVHDNLVAHEMVSPRAWQGIVTNALQAMQEGAYHKVVLARGVKINLPSNETFDILSVLYHLRQCYCSAYIFAMQRGEQYFCGATPERLARVHKGQVQTMALAGSSPRGMTETEDQDLGFHLLQSEKNLKEHALVVATICDALQTLCSEVNHACGPTLLLQKNIQHLCTSIVGTLLPGQSLLDIVAALHPTPAVGGVPRQAALAIIREKEHLDRGWYAGPIGWLSANGDGEYAVALRSALVAKQQAVLFAGCGIVAESKAEEEYRETCWKLQVMMRSLKGGD